MDGLHAANGKDTGARGRYGIAVVIIVVVIIVGQTREVTNFVVRVGRRRRLCRG